MKKKRGFLFLRTKPGFTPLRLIGLIVGLLIFFAINDYFGLTIMLISSIFTLTSSGKEIDTIGLRTRNFTSLGNLFYGKWEKLPQIKYIAVVRMLQGKKSFHASSVSIIQVPTDQYVYQLNFVVDVEKKEIIKLCEGEMTATIGQALQLGEMMNLRVLDFSTPDHKWIR